MKLNIKQEVLEDIITSTITVAELGSTDIDADTELGLLHDYVKYVKYSDIDFKANFKIVNGTPVITDEEADGTNVIGHEINDLIDKKFVVDENFEVTFVQDVKKIKEAELNSVLNTRELYAQATATLFVEKVKAEVEKKLDEIKKAANGFEAETEVVL